MPDEPVATEQDLPSRGLYEGYHRAAARSFLYGIGYTREALGRPIVGVAHSWTSTMPCNFNHRDLAAAAESGVREAGGTPMQFSTIAISDGITMGTDGMRASLISRAVITSTRWSASFPATRRHPAARWRLPGSTAPRCCCTAGRSCLACSVAGG